MNEKSTSFPIRNAALALASRLVVGGGATLAVIFLAQGFEPNDFSAFRFYQISIVMLVAVAGPGISITASKMFAQNDQSDDATIQPVGPLWIASVLLGAIVSVAVGLMPDWIVADDIPVSAWILALGLFVGTAAIVPVGALMGLEKFGELLVIDAVSVAILIFGVLLAARLGNVDFAVWLLITSQAFVVLASSVFTLRAITVATFFESLRTSLRIAELRRMLGAAAPNAVIGIAMTLQFWGIAKIMLVRYADPLAFAFFSIGMQWFSLACLVPGVLARIVFPRSVRLASGAGDGDDVERRRLARLSLGLVLAATVAITLLGLLAGPLIMPLYGQTFGTDGFLIGVYAAAAIPFCIASAIGFQVIAKGGEVAWMVLSVCQLCVVLFVCYLFDYVGSYAGAIAIAAGGAAASVGGVVIARSRNVV